MVKIRKFRRMTDEEQKATGYPTDIESIKEGIAPIETLGFDPFVTYDDIEENQTSYGKFMCMSPELEKSWNEACPAVKKIVACAIKQAMKESFFKLADELNGRNDDQKKVY